MAQSHGGSLSGKSKVMFSSSSSSYDLFSLTLNKTSKYWEFIVLLGDFYVDYLSTASILVTVSHHSL